MSEPSKGQGPKGRGSKGKGSKGQGSKGPGSKKARAKQGPPPGGGAKSRRRQRRNKSGAGPGGERKGNRTPWLQKGASQSAKDGGPVAEKEAEKDGRAAPRSELSRPHRKRAHEDQAALKTRPREFRVTEIVDFTGLEKRTSGSAGSGKANKKAKRAKPYFWHRLIKRKMTTQQAVDKIARDHDVPRAKIQFGGLKDKQSYSEQVISIEGKAIDHRERDLKVALLGRHTRPMTSKAVKGNKFEITARELEEWQIERLPQAIKEAARDGVPFYFDSQRFGSVRFGQGFIARALVKGDPEEALRRLMATPSRADHSSDKHIKLIMSEQWGDWERLSRRFAASPYGRILAYLDQHPGDFWGAVGAMRRPLRAFHLFCYQSYVFNRTLAHFLEGVLPRRAQFTVPYVCGEHVFFEALDDDQRTMLHSLELPMVGPDLDLKAHEPAVREAVEAALAEEGVTLEQFRLPRACQGFFKTEMRKAVFVPTDLSAGEAYKERKRRKRNRSPEEGGRPPAEPKLLLDLRFTLPRGAYATLLIKRLFRA
ncbi:MAG: tRNA pseudouridine(13) synthase TruD [Planctomycetota bacterium]|jgi:tRNA pseudouridine13 synthase